MFNVPPNTLFQRGTVDPKFHVEGVASPSNHSFSQKTRLMIFRMV